MDCEDLIRSLWREAEEKFRIIDGEAKAAAAKVEEETGLKISRLREEYEKKAASESAKRIEEVLSDAEKKARLLRTSASRMLSRRLYGLARSSLHLLRNDEGYGNAFKALAEELPPLAWKSVSVNPGDAGIARRCFPGLEIITDQKISGGMDVMTGDGKARVINTLDKRLEQALGGACPGSDERGL